MRLESWSDYVPPPGSAYRVHYVPDGHSLEPDVNTMNRALDRRPGVAVDRMDVENPELRTVVADIRTFVGDSSLLTIIGTFLSDGVAFWRIDYVERTDSGVPGVLGVTVERVMDAILDPVEDISTAASESVVETVRSVKKVGVPGIGIAAVAVVGFLIARAL